MREHRMRSSIRACPGCGRRPVRRPNRVADVCPRPASLVSAADVGSLLIRSSEEICYPQSMSVDPPRRTGSVLVPLIRR